MANCWWRQCSIISERFRLQFEDEKEREKKMNFAACEFSIQLYCETTDWMIQQTHTHAILRYLFFFTLAHYFNFENPLVIRFSIYIHNFVFIFTRFFVFKENLFFYLCLSLPLVPSFSSHLLKHIISIIFFVITPWMNVGVRQPIVGWMSSLWSSFNMKIYEKNNKSKETHYISAYIAFFLLVSLDDRVSARACVRAPIHLFNLFICISLALDSRSSTLSLIFFFFFDKQIYIGNNNWKAEQ